MEGFSELYSVQLFIPAERDGRVHLATRYSEATDSLMVPSETALSHVQGRGYIEELEANHALGLERAQGKVLRGWMDIPQEDIEKCDESCREQGGVLERPYVEPHGKARGLAFHSARRAPYFTAKPLEHDRFQEHVVLVPLDDLGEAMGGREESELMRDLYMDVDGTKYRINAGVVKAYRCLAQRAPELFG